MATTALLGSTLFALTWKAWATPSGRWLPLLRATAHRKGVTVYTGWPTHNSRTEDTAVLTHYPTPCASDGEAGPRTPGQKAGGAPGLNFVVTLASWPTPNAEDFGYGDLPRLEARRAKYAAIHGNNGFGLTLGQTAALNLSTCQTPTVTCGRGASYSYSRGDHNQVFLALPGQAQLATWPTPITGDGARGGMADRANGGKTNLVDYAQLVLWATPNARDWKSEILPSDWLREGQGQPRERLALLTDSGETPSGSRAGTVSGGQLNPALCRWLMGIPPVWDSCALRILSASSTRSSGPAGTGPAGSAGTGTPSARRKRSRSSKPSSKKKGAGDAV